VDPENGPYMVQNAVAVALIMKLSHWCAQLFLLTIFCLTNCGGPTFRKGASAEEKRTATFQEVRRSILYASSQRRLNTVTEMEMKVSSLFLFQEREEAIP
jgi:hypothetical protein